MMHLPEIFKGTGNQLQSEALRRLQRWGELNGADQDTSQIIKNIVDNSRSCG